MDWAAHIGRILSRLGEDATFTHAGSSAASVRGMFTAPYERLPSGLDGGFDASLPRFAALTADLPGAAQNDTLARGGVTYTIVDVQHDDPGGFTVLQLRESS